jgi:pimeloyl-ACP methyl ester carboxylesterase
MPNEWPVNLRRHFEYHFTGVQRLEVSRDAVARVKAPVLTIHGTWDRNAPYAAGREWALTLPNARLITVERAARLRPMARPGREDHYARARSEVIARAAALPRNASSTICACCSIP